MKKPAAGPAPVQPRTTPSYRTAPGRDDQRHDSPSGGSSASDGGDGTESLGMGNVYGMDGLGDASHSTEMPAREATFIDGTDDDDGYDR